MTLSTAQGHPTARKQLCSKSRPTLKNVEATSRANRKTGGVALLLRVRTPARHLTLTMAELGEADEAELQRLVAAEQQKAQFTAQVRG